MTFMLTNLRLIVKQMPYNHSIAGDSGHLSSALERMNCALTATPDRGFRRVETPKILELFQERIFENFEIGLEVFGVCCNGTA